MLEYIVAAAVAAGVAKKMSSSASNAEKAKEKYAKLEAEKEAREKQRREANEIARQQAAAKANARRQAEEQRRKAMAESLNQLYAKFAICYYIALADGTLGEKEKSALDRLCLDIYNAFPQPAVKSELLKIYNTPDMNFIVLERYIRNVDPAVIASFLSLADETAALDGGVTEKEKECIYKLRKYLTDKTGFDYLTNCMHLDTDVDLQCPGCGSGMKLVPYDNKAVCPYCGHVKYLNPSK